MPVTPDCYFTVNDPENPVAVHYRDIVRATHLFWESQVPRGDEAMRTSVARLVKDTGARPYTLKKLDHRGTGCTVSAAVAQRASA